MYVSVELLMYLAYYILIGIVVLAILEAIELVFQWGFLPSKDEDIFPVIIILGLILWFPVIVFIVLVVMFTTILKICKLVFIKIQNHWRRRRLRKTDF